jgi:hypothetical protein
MTAITLKLGDATTITETITGLTSLTGYTARMYVYSRTGTLIDTFNGTVSGLTVTYDILNEDSRLFTMGAHSFETKLWDSSDHVYTPSVGVVNVETALNSNPS